MQPQLLDRQDTTATDLFVAYRLYACSVMLLPKENMQACAAGSCMCASASSAVWPATAFAARSV
jgi:hypothetical protein